MSLKQHGQAPVPVQSFPRAKAAPPPRKTWEIPIVLDTEAKSSGSRSERVVRVPSPLAFVLPSRAYTGPQSVRELSRNQRDWTKNEMTLDMERRASDRICAALGLQPSRPLECMDLWGTRGEVHEPVQVEAVKAAMDFVHQRGGRDLFNGAVNEERAIFDGISGKLVGLALWIWMQGDRSAGAPYPEYVAEVVVRPNGEIADVHEEQLVTPE